MLQVAELFIPIMGKQYYANPDILIALVVTLGTVVCLSYWVSFRQYFKEKSNRRFLDSFDEIYPLQSRFIYNFGDNFHSVDDFGVHSRWFSVQRQ